jgi:cell wall-associated NlpC family hydrolase
MLNMSKIFKYFPFFVILVLIITACQPSVRFTKNENPRISSNKKQTQEKPVHNSSITKSEKENEVNLDDSRLSILKEAEKLLGTPYCSGGENKDCMDCSGFTMTIYEIIGINLPRSAAEQYEYSSKIYKNDVIPGDLVFFGDGSRISHVGIYTGHEEFIHSSSSKGVIRQSLSDPYYKKKLIGFGRVMKESLNSEKIN